MKKLPHGKHEGCCDLQRRMFWVLFTHTGVHLMYDDCLVAPFLPSFAIENGHIFSPSYAVPSLLDSVEIKCSVPSWSLMV